MFEPIRPAGPPSLVRRVFFWAGRLPGAEHQRSQPQAQPHRRHQPDRGERPRDRAAADRRRVPSGGPAPGSRGRPAARTGPSRSAGPGLRRRERTASATCRPTLPASSESCSDESPGSRREAGRHADAPAESDVDRRSPRRRVSGYSSSPEPIASRFIQGRKPPGQTHSSVWCQSSAASGSHSTQEPSAASSRRRLAGKRGRGGAAAAASQGQRPWVRASGILARSPAAAKAQTSTITGRIIGRRLRRS